MHTYTLSMLIQIGMIYKINTDSIISTCIYMYMIVICV